MDILAEKSAVSIMQIILEAIFVGGLDCNIDLKRGNIENAIALCYIINEFVETI